MGSDTAQGQTFLNFTVPKKYGDASGFQPGSTFKAFVLASAINQGIPLTTQINSPDTITVNQGDFKVCDGQYYPSTQPYPVHNSTGYGTFDLYSGTRESVNTFYVQLEERTGLCEPYTLAQKMGITQLQDTNQWMVPSFTLGVADVSPLEMAEAYATFAARGEHCAARPVTSIEDSNGNTLKSYPEQCEQDGVGRCVDGVQKEGKHDDDDNEEEATHRRSPLLDDVPVRTKLAPHPLAEARVAQQAKVGGHQHPYAGEREDERLDDRDHAPPSSRPVIAATRRSNLEAREALTKMLSPEETRSRQSLGDLRVAQDRKSTRLNSSHIPLSRMPSSA